VATAQGYEARHWTLRRYCSDLSATRPSVGQSLPC
jgi:hypothetical protein